MRGAFLFLVCSFVSGLRGLWSSRSPYQQNGGVARYALLCVDVRYARSEPTCLKIRLYCRVVHASRTLYPPRALNLSPTEASLCSDVASHHR